MERARKSAIALIERQREERGREWRPTAARRAVGCECDARKARCVPGLGHLHEPHLESAAHRGHEGRAVDGVDDRAVVLRALRPRVQAARCGLGCAGAADGLDDVRLPPGECRERLRDRAVAQLVPVPTAVAGGRPLGAMVTSAPGSCVASSSPTAAATAGASTAPSDAPTSLPSGGKGASRTPTGIGRGRLCVEVCLVDGRVGRLRQSRDEAIAAVLGAERLGRHARRSSSTFTTPASTALSVTCGSSR